jgi:acetoin utilization protein AcuB
MYIKPLSINYLFKKELFMKKYLNILVDEYSSPIEKYIDENEYISNAFAIMNQYYIRHIPVVKNNIPIGIITKHELNILNCLDKLNNLKAKDIMIKDPHCVLSGTLIEDVAFEMSQNKINYALVINSNGELDSIFTSIDALNALIEIVREDSYKNH